MERFTVFLLITCLAGCATQRPITGNPSDLQQRIASGELLKRGDHVEIVTNDGRAYEFNVASVSTSSIDGKHESVPIEQVASMQKREFSVGKTSLVAASTVVGIALVVALIRGVAAAAILNASH